MPGLDEVGAIASDEVSRLCAGCPHRPWCLAEAPWPRSWGQFLCRMGVRTALIQRSNHILSFCDEAIWLDL